MKNKYFIFTGGRTGFITQPIPYKVYSAKDIVKLRGGDTTVEVVNATYGNTCTRWREVDVSKVKKKLHKKS